MPLTVWNDRSGGTPRIRGGWTTRFSVDGEKGYLIVWKDAGGGLAEVTVKIAKQGSTLAGLMDALSTAVSEGLKAGAPLSEYVAEFSGTRFVPAGPTDDAEVPRASSLMDCVARRMAIDFPAAPPGGK
ncbi:hypothetical protein DMB66_23165 [Actinoplanes sp. ATCC 53533]|uniref:TSCPD domain-containing protein n=1 Tax=Actinoplanes sp. ATCC 53533 TaxID=1288362 RepID=UPI000F78BFCE|nr:hypothetical protein [Actinoplanes sp. ATCC 53533]RSM61966.1 hypothetical protein DMB66_23165 [Actinoplanes sp. ATCC 53533]